MAENKVYLALGEESDRGTGEVTTVGFIPVVNPPIMTPEFIERARVDWRGEDIVKGDVDWQRLGQSWVGTYEMPMYTEAGTTAGIVGTLFKHFFGDVTTAENATTGQYYHMFYPVTDMFGAAQLGTKAITHNTNINEGTTMKNWPFVGGRIPGLTFTSVVEEHLIVGVTAMGQFRDTTTAELGSQTFAAENLRCDYNNLKVYTGTITRTGTGPNFSDFGFGSATEICPDSIAVTITNGMVDKRRLCGKDYPDKTTVGKFEVIVEMVIDWEDPASGFSSVDDLNAWINADSSTNLFLHWDTGTQAGTGDNHQLYLDIPIAQRTGGAPEYSDIDPIVTLTYKGLYDATTTKYLIGLMLKNTASAV